MKRPLWFSLAALILGCSSSSESAGMRDAESGEERDAHAASEHDAADADAGAEPANDASDTSVAEDGATQDACASVRCEAHAECVVSGGVGACRCLPGYQGSGGAGCTAPVDPCVAAHTCPDGKWIRHALPGIAAVDTVQTVRVDPVRPSDFYAFVGSNNGPTIKVYASTDFGESWTQRNTTAEITGNPWGASIDPNPQRDPATPPTMWCPSGYGAQGAWKSVDGGKTWQRSKGADDAFAPYNPFGATDLYHIAILPDDPPNHVLATYHYYFKDQSEGGFGETWDGGKTWVVHPPPPGVGTSHYVVPISGTTWVVIAQDNNGANGMWRTTSAGRVGGTAAKKFRDGTISVDAWRKVDDLEHAHGSHENVVMPNGVILVTGWTNGAVSRDEGATWQHFTAMGSWAPPHQFEQSDITNLAVTERFVYTNFLANPTLARAPLSAVVGAENWSVEYCARPADYTVGGAPFGMASSFNADAKRWVVMAGSLDGSIWKYVEPPP